MRICKKIWDTFIIYLNRGIELLTAFLLLEMVVLVFMQIVSRGLFGNSFSWTEEIARFSMIWITFLGAAIAFQYGAHIGIDYFVKKLPQVPDKIIGALGSMICGIFFVVVAYQGWLLMDSASMQRSPALQLSMTYVYAIIPVSVTMMLINLVDVTMKRMMTETLYQEKE